MNPPTGETLWDYAAPADRETLTSSVIAWLLSPQGNHGLGRAFLTRFAEAAGVPLPHGTIEVRPEAWDSREKRFDILLCADDKRSCVVEVKCKTAGSAKQLERYDDGTTRIVRVGFHEWNFPDLSAGQRRRFPLVTFDTIAAIVDAAAAESGSPYERWLQDFSRQLRRERDTFAAIRRYFIDESSDELPTRPSLHRYSERFLNELFWKWFVDQWSEEHPDEQWGWTIRSERSGVWCGNCYSSRTVREGELYRSTPLGLEISGKFYYWVHLELFDRTGVLARPGTIAGSVQLRISNDLPSENRERIFRSILDAKPVWSKLGFRAPARRRPGDSYTALRKDFEIQDFRYSRIKELVYALAERSAV